MEEIQQEKVIILIQDLITLGGLDPRERGGDSY
jgi:hypothetical protein